MKVGQVEFVWRSHRQAFVIKIGAQKAADIHREGVGNIKEFSFSEALQYIPEGVNPIEYERKIDAEIRAERQALVDLWKQDDQAWNLYCYGKRASK